MTSGQSFLTVACTGVIPALIVIKSAVSSITLLLPALCVMNTLPIHVFIRFSLPKFLMYSVSLSVWGSSEERRGSGKWMSSYE